MAYAEKVPSPKGDYWRGKYKDPEGNYVSVRNEHNEVIRFASRAKAEQAGDVKEAEIDQGTYRDPKAGAVLFKHWAAIWYASLELSQSTMVNYRRHLENHLIPFFGETALIDIDQALIVKWKREERTDRADEDSIRTWAGTLHNVLDDAVPKYIGTNPAAKKRGKGKRSGAGRRTRARGPEVPVTGPLGVLLIAERMSILTGRDDEFVLTLDMFWNAHRLGEAVGLEKAYVRGHVCKVQWQLYEIETKGNEQLKAEAPGGFLRCPPKDDSRRDAHMAPFMAALLAGHLERTVPQKCACHGRAYVFGGWQEAKGRRGTVPLRDIAALAGVSDTIVSAVLGSRSGTRVSDATREKVMEAVRVSGWQPVERADGPAPHWRRSSLEERFTAAASGEWPARKKNHRPRQAVSLRGEWPGELVSGRNNQARAEWCWMPVVPLPEEDDDEAVAPHPHLLRHWVKTWMDEVRIPEVLSEELLGHEIPGVSGVYRHVSGGMRAELAAKMTAAWEAALDARLEMSPRSPVAVLDALLLERSEARKPRLIPPIFSRDSPETPEAVLPFPGHTASGQRRGDRI